MGNDIHAKNIIIKLTKELRRYSFDSKMNTIRNFSHFCDYIQPKDSSIDTILVNSNIKITDDFKEKIKLSIHNYILEYLALSSIIDGECEGHLKNFSEYNNFRRSINIYNDYSTNYFFEKNIKFGINDFISKTLLQQEDMQMYYGKKIRKFSKIFSLSSAELNMKELFKKYFKYDYSEYIDLGIVVFYSSVSYISKNENFNIRGIVDFANDFLGYNSEKTNFMLSKISITRNDFHRKYTEASSKIFFLKPFDFNPLKTYPIILEKGNEYLPIPNLIFVAVSEGFYYQIFDLERLEFKEKFGKHIFEPYVLKMFDNNNLIIIPEFPYSKDKKFADITLVKDNDIILVELKSQTPTLRYRSGKHSDYEKEIITNCSEILIQCCKKEIDLREGKVINEKLPSTINNIYFLGITMNEFYITMTDDLRESILNNELFVKNEKCSNLLKNKKFHIMSSDVLDDFLKHETKDLFEFLEQRENGILKWSDFISTQIRIKKNKKIKNEDYFYDRMIQIKNKGKLKK